MCLESLHCNILVQIVLNAICCCFFFGLLLFLFIYFFILIFYGGVGRGGHDFSLTFLLVTMKSPNYKSVGFEAINFKHHLPLKTSCSRSIAHILGS